MKSKINVKQEQRIGKFVRDFSIVVQDERSVNYNILRNMLRELLNSQDQEEEKECECCKLDDMGYTHEPYCPLFKEYKQDTPEEWEKSIKDCFNVTVFGEDGNDIYREVVTTRVLEKVKELLDERERAVVERIVRETRNMERLSIKQGVKGDKAMKRLRGLIESLYRYNLLNNKKK